MIDWSKQSRTSYTCHIFDHRWIFSHGIHHSSHIFLKTFRIRPNLASTMLMSPTMAAKRIDWRYQRTRLWTPCNFMASLTILTVNIFWRLTSHLTIFFARTRIKVYNRSKWVEEIGKSIEHWADSALQLSIQRKDRRSPGNKGEWVSLPHNYISGARRA